MVAARLCWTTIWRQADRSGEAVSSAHGAKSDPAKSKGYRSCYVQSSGAEILRRHGSVVDATKRQECLARCGGDGGRARLGRRSIAMGSSDIWPLGRASGFCRFLGWTLPGVFGAGGLQALVKGGLSVEGKRVVVAGSRTPSSWRLAAHSAGSTERRLSASQNRRPLRQLLPFAASLLWSASGQAATRARATVHHSLRSVPIARAAGRLRSEGEYVGACGAANRTAGTCGVSRAICWRAGFISFPNTELAALLGCKLSGDFVEVRQCEQQTNPLRMYFARESRLALRDSRRR
jgi:hypothetical protein